MSADAIQESVPPFIKRLGDVPIQGSNNTLIVLGTDRAAAGPASIDDGLGTIEAPGGGKETGTIHIVAGRQDAKGNPDLSDDLAYVYVTMKTDVDKNTGLSGVQSDAGRVPAIVLKSDSVRLVFRKDVKISSADGSSYVYIDAQGNLVSNQSQKASVVSQQINLGADPSSHPAILGDNYRSSEDVMLQVLQTTFTALATCITAIGVGFTASGVGFTAVGAGLPPIAPAMGTAAAACGTAAGACGAGAAACTQAAAAIQTFIGKASTYLSRVVFFGS